jgi:capsular polysaccharide biosynthesis protein
MRNVGMWRTWPLIIVMTFVAAGVGYAATLRTPTTYRATTSILVGKPFQSPTVNTDNFEASEQLALAYADVIRRQPVLEGVVDALGLDMSWQQLSRLVRVTVPSTNPHLILITVETRSPETATAIAGEVASQVIALSPTQSQSQAATATNDFVRSRLEILQNDITRSQARVDELERQLAAESGTGAEKLRLSLEAQQRFLVDLQDNYASLLQILAMGDLPNSLEVLEESGSKASPVQSNSLFVGLLAGCVGFLLSLGLAYLLEFRGPGSRTGESLHALPTRRPPSESERVRSDFGTSRSPQGPPAPHYQEQEVGHSLGRQE